MSTVRIEEMHEQMSIRKPEAVFFDWDGTLADSFIFLHTAHNHVCEILGRPSFSLKEYEGYFGQPRERLYKEIYGDKMDEAKIHFERYVLSNHLSGLKPAEGADALLRTLQSMRIPCGVVSNKKRSLIDAEIANFGWRDFFVSVVGAGEAKADKPSPAPLFLAVERASLVACMADIWFVGDTDNDLICAEKAGCVAVLVERQSIYDNLSASHKIDLHRRNCEGLKEFFLSMPL